MPLRCLDPASGRSIQAFDLSSEAWRALEQQNRLARHLRMACCAAPVTLRRSRLGTQFFAHKAKGDCQTAPETEAHLRLKQMAVEAARANGWEAATEVAGTTPEGERWTADVLALRGRHKVAVEVQWSPQTNEETLRRQKRYAASGVRGLWLFRRGDFPIDFALPAARVGGDAAQGFEALVPTGAEEQRVAMVEFLNAAFSQRLRYGLPTAAEARICARVGSTFCWRCGVKIRIVTGVDVAVGPHRFTFSVPDLSEYADLFGTVRAHIPSSLGVGPIRHRYSAAQERSYLSNGCVECEAFIGEYYEHDAWDDQAEACWFSMRLSERWREAIRSNGEKNYDPAWAVYPTVGAEPALKTP